MEGLPNNHDHYRQRICDYIERNEEEYAPFVEDDRTLAQVWRFFAFSLSSSVFAFQSSVDLYIITNKKF